MKTKTIILTLLLTLLLSTNACASQETHSSFGVTANDEIIINYKHFIELTFSEFIYSYDQSKDTLSITQAEFTYKNVTMIFDWYDEIGNTTYDYDVDRFFYDSVNNCFVITDSDKNLLDMFY